MPLTLGIISVLTVLGVLAGLLFARKVGITSSRHLILWIGIVAVVLGLLLLTVDTLGLERAERTRHWPSAQGFIVSSELITKGEIYGPLIIYQYSVAGTTYVDSTDAGAPGFGNKNKRYNVAEYILAEYKPGTSVVVSYDPNDPRTSTIVPGPRWRVFGQLGLGGTLYLIGLCLLVVLLRGASGSRATDTKKETAS
jgi:hypothetical protein